MTVGQALRLWVIFLFALLFLGGSSVPLGDKVEHARAFTRPIEFDYVGWTIDAIGIKLGQTALGADRYLLEGQQKQVVFEYIDLIKRVGEVESQLNDIYADPNIQNPDNTSHSLRSELDELQRRRAMIEPLAESIIQDQISNIISIIGLDTGGQPLPPILYHTTPPPAALIISPREEIRQIANISIEPGITVDEREALEEEVDESLNVSSLVVSIGGVGIYPTMVMQTTDMNWLMEVIAHEWVHNYLTLRPLGVSFMTSPELRTMNETTASIAGKEIGRIVMERYYPELVPPPSPPSQPESPSQQQEGTLPAFDFQAEMRITRETTDQLLAEGKIELAESYMEIRRRFFWDHGYHLRKLNQAYFAFHGAYADQPGGAAGEDPVGAAVRALRDQSVSLVEFIDRISWMWSINQLFEAVGDAE